MHTIDTQNQRFWSISKRGERSMSVQDLVNILVNNGVAVACVAYFMYFNNTTMKEFTKAMTDMQATMIQVVEKLEQVSDNCKEKGGD